MIKLWADFNASTDKGLRLNCRGTIEDLSKQNIELKEGLKLALWCEDTDENDNPDNLVVEAIAHFDDKQKIWEAVFEWKDIKHESENKSKAFRLKNISQADKGQ
jgi:hypothetical protein